MYSCLTEQLLMFYTCMLCKFTVLLKRTGKFHLFAMAAFENYGKMSQRYINMAIGFDNA